MLRIIHHQRCPVNLKYNPLKPLVYMVCRAFFVRDDLNLKPYTKSFTGILGKAPPWTWSQINNAERWYQKVLLAGSVLKPRYNTSCKHHQIRKAKVGGMEKELYCETIIQ